MKILSIVLFTWGSQRCIPTMVISESEAMSEAKVTVPAAAGHKGVESCGVGEGGRRADRSSGDR